MPREMKIRVWDKVSKCMIYFDKPWICEEYSSIAWSSSQYDGIGELPGSYKYLSNFAQNIKIEDVYELMEYTGLKDKNGKEIYEGDILELSYFLTRNKGIVKYGKYKQCNMSNDYECGNQGFYVDVQNDKNDTNRHDIYFYAHRAEIIGNIYENEKLLEGKKDGK